MARHGRSGGRPHHHQHHGAHYGHHHHHHHTGSYSRGGARNYNYFQMELDSTPQSNATNHVIRYSRETNGFDASSYNPSFCDNNVSQFDVGLFVQEINALSETPVSNCNWFAFLHPLIMVLSVGGIIGVSLGILLNLEKRVAVYNKTTKQTTYESKGGIPLVAGIVSVILIDLALFALLIVSSICFNKCSMQRLTKRRNAIMQVVDKYQPQFNSKNVFIRLPTYGAYITLEYKGKPAVAIAEPLQPQGIQMMLMNVGEMGIQQKGVLPPGFEGTMPVGGPGFEPTPYQPPPLFQDPAAVPLNYQNHPPVFS